MIVLVQLGALRTNFLNHLDSLLKKQNKPVYSHSDYEGLIPFIKVPVIQHPETIPAYLRNWIGPGEKIGVDYRFYLMKREVTIGEFEVYFEGLSDQEKRYIGLDWLKDENGRRYPVDWAVTSIPHEAAKNYAVWISDRTKRQFQLVSREEWKTAVAIVGVDQIALKNKGEKAIDKSELTGFLERPHEWSRDRCDDIQHMVLGKSEVNRERFITRRGATTSCSALKSSQVGFRLMMRE